MNRYLKFTNRRFFFTIHIPSNITATKTVVILHTDCKIIKIYVKIPAKLKIH